MPEIHRSESKTQSRIIALVSFLKKTLPPSKEVGALRLCCLPLFQNQATTAWIREFDTKLPSVILAA